MPDRLDLGVTGKLASFARSSTGLEKATCDNCKHTVVIATIDGKRVELDTELITVVTDNPRKRTDARQRLSGRRLHAQSCERLAREAAKDRERTARADWEAKQPAKRAKLADLTLEQLVKLAETTRDAGVTFQREVGRVTRAISEVAGKKRGARTRGM